MLESRLPRMRDPVDLFRRRFARRRGRGQVPLLVGSYAAPSALRPLQDEEAALATAFHKLYYDLWAGGGGGRGTIDLSWFGYRTLKSPVDLWTYQEILVETRPDVVVETGTQFGGSAYFLAALMDLLGHGEVLSVDINARPGRPEHPRITYVLGSSTDPAIVDRVRAAVAGKRAMVVLDSDHSEPHVTGELAAYHDLVAVGCYLIVEDSNVNGHPVLPEFGPGPMEAIDAFLEGRDDFVVDPDRERFLLTLNPRGYLRRIR